MDLPTCCARPEERLEILAAHPKVEIRHMPEERDSWVIASTRSWNQVWQESRDADWVGIVVTDEIVRPDLSASLARHKAAGHTVLKPRGFDMVSETVDPASATRGVFNHRFSKPCLFRPGQDHNRQPRVRQPRRALRG